MEFKQLKKELDSGKVRPFYIFTGEEKEVLRKYIKRISPDVQTAQSLASIAGKLSSRGLFARKQTFVIHNDKEAVKVELSTLLKLIGNNTVILVYDSIDGRIKFFKEAKDYITEFKKFTEAQLAATVKRLLGTDVEPKISLMLSLYCGNDVARLELECHKLRSLGLPITEQLVDELVIPPVEDEIFKMTESIAKKDAVMAWCLYDNLRQLKESPIKMISILYTKFREIFLVQSMLDRENTEVCSKTGLVFWQVNKARELANRFSLTELLRHLKSIQKAEVDIKTGRIEDIVAWESLLLSILK